jgi:hypothetical protein
VGEDPGSSKVSFIILLHLAQAEHTSSSRLHPGSRLYLTQAASHIPAERPISLPRGLHTHSQNGRPRAYLANSIRLHLFFDLRPFAPFDSLFSLITLFCTTFSTTTFYFYHVQCNDVPAVRREDGIHFNANVGFELGRVAA